MAALRLELQLRDVKNLIVTGCDRAYIEQWTHELGVHSLWGSFPMTDTLPEIAEMVRTKLMSFSGADRFIMGARMFEAARQMALASLPANLPPEELKRQLFERIYGVPAPF